MNYIFINHKCEPVLRSRTVILSSFNVFIPNMYIDYFTCNPMCTTCIIFVSQSYLNVNTPVSPKAE